MKRKVIKIATSTAVAASAFVTAAPAQQATAATNINSLVTNAQNAGVVLKWAISVEGFADFKTRPYVEYNTTKKAIQAAEEAADKLSTSEKLSVQAKLVDPKVQVKRAQAYIDAISSSEKIVDLTKKLEVAIDSANLEKVEAAYHTATAEYRKQAKLLDRVYGQSTRDGIRHAVKPAFEKLVNEVTYDITVKMHVDKASAYVKENKFVEAGAELIKADNYLTDSNATFTFKKQLEKSYTEVMDSIPLKPLSATSDGQNTVTINFSKAYDIPLTNLEAGQFKISGETVQSAKLSDDKKSVILTTSDLDAAKDYTVTWKGDTVHFTTDAVGDSTGITLKETDVAYLETTNSRTYTAKITNRDGSPYVGRVRISLAETNPATDTTSTSAVITAANGPAGNGGQEWTAFTDLNGNLVFTIAAAYGSNVNTTSVTYIQPTIQKLDGDEMSKKAPVTHFFQLQNVNNTYMLNMANPLINIENNYVFTNEFKYKWDSNDQFFIHGQMVTEKLFEAALSKGDTVAVDYHIKTENTSSWNITLDGTAPADLEFTNPVKSPVTYDGINYDISGTAQPGYTVKVYLNGRFLGRDTVDASGNWTLGAVNLIQNESNTFVAYQYAPGKDGDHGVGSENPTTPATTIIHEGAFASTEISFQDKDVNGLSISDTLDFSFLNDSYGHEFKKTSTGTMTIGDGQGRNAVVKVNYVDENSLQIVDFVFMDSSFQYNSATLHVKATTGIVNQDQLSYNVYESQTNGSTLLVKR